MQYVIPTPPRVALLKDKLGRSKLKNPNRRDPGHYKCGSNLSQICNIISLENELTDRRKSKTYKINFEFDCNSQCVIYLITLYFCISNLGFCLELGLLNSETKIGTGVA